MYYTFIEYLSFFAVLELLEKVRTSFGFSPHSWLGWALAGSVWFGVYFWLVGWDRVKTILVVAVYIWWVGSAVYLNRTGWDLVKTNFGVAAVTATPSTTRSQAPATRSLDKAVAKAALAGSTTTHSSRQHSHVNHE